MLRNTAKMFLQQLGICHFGIKYALKPDIFSEKNVDIQLDVFLLFLVSGYWFLVGGQEGCTRTRKKH